MSNQAQIDAIEQLLLAFLKSRQFKVDTELAFEKASSALMGSDGPPGTIEKTQAVNYLAHLKLQLK
ncbi:hypothetical protein M1B34_28085 [Pseudomonas sp. MAFF 302030]|uniref:Uncharacterized protein n=1 Tax=Pseudomonas morbosilactucae TaxID=2938197 RepID=A0A9X1Z0M3_9PSED|nr:hypothetical protein [Pseudomonas morbosilactucae]MCK9801424.1 hypothetical protein [Pseudomonas morbosilactucae]